MERTRTKSVKMFSEGLKALGRDSRIGSVASSYRPAKSPAAASGRVSRIAGHTSRGGSSLERRALARPAAPASRLLAAQPCADPVHLVKNEGALFEHGQPVFLVSDNGALAFPKLLRKL